jgi:catalase
MRTDGNLGGTLTFHPNSAGLWDNQPDFAEPPMPVDGDGAHWDHRVDDDHWEQPGNLFRKMTPAQQQALFENTARAMGDARAHIKQRHVDNCTRADPAYGAGVARALGITSQQRRTAAE